MGRTTHSVKVFRPRTCFKERISSRRYSISILTGEAATPYFDTFVVIRECLKKSLCGHYVDYTEDRLQKLGVR